MNPDFSHYYGLALILAYFTALVVVSWYTSKGETGTQAFFVANRSSKWYLVAFGMIGTSLSGVTFISVPGMVNAGNLHYLQIVFGYLIGYTVIANVLMPLYYRLQLVSIYEYFEMRYKSKFPRRIITAIFVLKVSLRLKIYALLVTVHATA